MNNDLNNKKQSLIVGVCILAYFLLVLIWSINEGFDTNAEENMRLDIARFVFKYNKLPTVFDKEIFNSDYGFSYAGYGNLGMWITALIMRVFTSFFPYSKILIAERALSVICAPIFMYICLKIGETIFNNRSKALLLMFVICLFPNHCLIFTYANNESVMMVGIALNIFYMAKGLKHTWSIRNCILLAISDIIILLSYADGYGYVLVSSIVLVVTLVKREKTIQSIKKVCTVLAVVFVGAGWFFIRNLILYGSLFGSNITARNSQIYGKSGFVSTELSKKAFSTMFSISGFSNFIKKNILLYPGAFKNVTRTFPLIIRIVILWMILIAIILCFVKIKKEFKKWDSWKKIFSITLLVNILISFILYFYYSAFNDYIITPRYLLPIAIPFGIIFVTGYDYLFVKVKSNKYFYNIGVFSIAITLFVLDCYGIYLGK